jgi:hypothetical protein
VRWPLALVWVVILSAIPQGADAHGRSTSTASWEIHSGPAPEATVRVQAMWSDLQRALPGLAGLGPEALGARADLLGQIDAYLTAHYVLLVDGDRCMARRPHASPVPERTHLARRWKIECASDGPLRIRADGFVDGAPGHLHLARLRIDAAAPVERVFVLATLEQAVHDDEAAGGPQAGSFADFTRLGIEHIVTGYDHLVFLLALLLVGVSLVEVATVVTGFTVAHSITLALGVLGVVQPQAAAVEALIGLSIVVVALENTSVDVSPRARRAIQAGLLILFVISTGAAAAGLTPIPAAALAGIGIFSLCYFAMLPRVARPFRLRWLLAFVFGLVHGFGFAGILTEMELPPARLASALLGFNVGVELGQIGLVALAWPVLRVLLGGAALRRVWVVQTGSAAVLAAGMYWFASRALG